MPLDTIAAGQDDPGKEGQSSGLVKRRISNSSSSSSYGGGGSQDLNQMELQQRHSSMMDEEGASQRKKRKFDVLYYKGEDKSDQREKHTKSGLSLFGQR